VPLQDELGLFSKSLRLMLVFKFFNKNSLEEAKGDVAN
jgi:hypothetical protein